MPSDGRRASSGPPERARRARRLGRTSGRRSESSRRPQAAPRSPPERAGEPGHPRQRASEQAAGRVPGHHQHPRSDLISCPLARRPPSPTLSIRRASVRRAAGLGPAGAAAARRLQLYPQASLAVKDAISTAFCRSTFLTAPRRTLSAPQARVFSRNQLTNCDRLWIATRWLVERRSATLSQSIVDVDARIPHRRRRRHRARRSLAEKARVPAGLQNQPPCRRGATVHRRGASSASEASRRLALRSGIRRSASPAAQPTTATAAGPEAGRPAAYEFTVNVSGGLPDVTGLGPTLAGLDRLLASASPQRVFGSSGREA